MQLVHTYQEDPELALVTFAHDIESYIHRFEVDIDYLVDWLSDYLDQHFNIDIDDGSLDIVAQTLLKIYSEEQEGRYEELEKLRKLKPVQLPKLTKVKTQPPPDLSDLSLSDAQAPTLTPVCEEPEVDEQGFTVVTSKKQRHKG